MTDKPVTVQVPPDLIETLRNIISWAGSAYGQKNGWGHLPIEVQNAIVDAVKVSVAAPIAVP